MAKDTQPEKAKALEQEWFFSGGMEYVPITILAATYEEALEKWQKKRVAVSPVDISLQDESVVG